MSSKSSPAGSTPHVKSARHQSSPNTPGTLQQPQQQPQQQVQQQQQQQQQQQPPNIDAPDDSVAPFPPPQTFDILPSLHALLVRLLSAPTKADGGAGDQASGGPSTTQPLSGGETLDSSGSASAMAISSGSLDPKELMTEASAIKIRIQKARAVVDVLPDIERTVGEQEDEIAQLERRIERLKEVIGDFGQRSTMAMGDADMNR